MRRDDVIRRLREHRAEIRRLGVSSLYLFGSAVRDERRPDSDIDFYFDYDDPRFSLIELVRLQDKLAELLGAPIDVMTRGSLHPRLSSAIQQGSLQVF